MFGIDIRSLDDRQQVTLDALARNVRISARFASGDLIQLIEENNAR